MRFLIATLALLLCPVAWGQFDPTPQTRLTSVMVALTQQQARTLDTIANDNARSVCRVISHEGAGRQGIGSGVYLGNAWVLTAKHVVEGNQWLTCEFGNESFKADWYIKSWNDSALIRLTKQPEVPAQTISVRALSSGEVVYLAGFDHGSRLRVYDGRITSINWSSGRTKSISHDVGTRMSINGNSGGPIWNANGQIVANLWGAVNGETFCVSNRELVAFVRETIAKHPEHAATLPRLPDPTGQRFPILGGSYQAACPTCPPAVPPPMTQPPVNVSPGGIDGVDGKDGVDGAPGKDGADGKDATVDIDALADAVLAKLPPLYPMWIDAEGNVIDEIPGGVRLGQTLPLRIKVLQSAGSN